MNIEDLLHLLYVFLFHLHNITIPEGVFSKIFARVFEICSACDTEGIRTSGLKQLFKHMLDFRVELLLGFFFENFVMPEMDL